MNATSTELTWLIYVTLATGLFWIPYILNRVLEQGVFNALWDPQGETDTAVPWARRMMKAHENAVENLAVFAPLVLAVHITGSRTEATAIACVVYFYARLGHYLAFTLALPVLRVLLFLTGFGAQLVLALTLIGWL